MQDTKTHWIELAKKAAREEDPEKMLALFQELNDLLEANKKTRDQIFPPAAKAS